MLILFWLSSKQQLVEPTYAISIIKRKVDLTASQMLFSSDFIVNTMSKKLAETLTEFRPILNVTCINYETNVIWRHQTNKAGHTIHFNKCDSQATCFEFLLHLWTWTGVARCFSGAETCYSVSVGSNGSIWPEQIHLCIWSLMHNARNILIGDGHGTS